MKQLLTIARLVFVKAWRSHLVYALLLIMLPILLAAWSFEVANPGFQTGFLTDVGGSVMSLFAGMLMVVLGFDHLFWAREQNTPWFYLSRAGNRCIFPGGKFAGITSILFIALLGVALTFTLFLRYNTGLWFMAPGIMALMIFFEFSLLGAALTLLATFASRLLAFGALLIIFVAGHNLDAVRTTVESYGSPVLNVVTEILLVLLPDFALFRTVWFADIQPLKLLLVSLYCLLMVSSYLFAAGMVLQRKDL